MAATGSRRWSRTISSIRTAAPASWSTRARMPRSARTRRGTTISTPTRPRACGAPSSRHEASDNITWINNTAVADADGQPCTTRRSGASPSRATRTPGSIWRGNTTFDGQAGDPSFRTNGGNSEPSAALNKLGVNHGAGLLGHHGLGQVPGLRLPGGPRRRQRRPQPPAPPAPTPLGRPGRRQRRQHALRRPATRSSRGSGARTSSISPARGSAAPRSTGSSTSTSPRRT